MINKNLANDYLNKLFRIILPLLWCLAALMLVSCDILSPHQTGNSACLYGLVTDPQGNRIEGAEIHLVYAVPALKSCIAVKDSFPPELPWLSFYVLPQSDNTIRLCWYWNPNPGYSESNVAAYRILRSTHNDVQTAQTISPDINPLPTQDFHDYSFTDYDVTTYTAYYYYLELITIQQDFCLYGPVYTTIPQGWFAPWPTVIPNCFSDQCKVSFYTPGNCFCKISIADSQSRICRLLFNGDLTSGHQEIYWNGLDNNDQDVPNGLYSVSVACYDEHLHLLSDSLRFVLKNRPDQSNQPVALSDTNGYRLYYHDQFRLPQPLVLLDDVSNPQGRLTDLRQFTVYVRKAGYRTAVRTIQLSDLHTSLKQNFVLQPE